MSNVRQIVIQHLKSIGADGLIDESGDCGCGIDDFAPCDSAYDACVPAICIKRDSSANAPQDNEGAHCYRPIDTPNEPEETHL